MVLSRYSYKYRNLIERCIYIYIFFDDIPIFICHDIYTTPYFFPFFLSLSLCFSLNIIIALYRIIRVYGLHNLPINATSI